MDRRTILVFLLALLTLTAVITLASCGEPPPSPPPSPVVLQPTAAPTPISIAPGPGLKMEISKVEIGADNKPVVTFKLTDERGNPVRVPDLDAGSLRFTIAKVVTDKETGLARHESYIVRDVKGNEYTFAGAKKQPALATAKQALSAMDSGGRLTQTDATFTYVFTNTIPADFDKSTTHVVGGQATRNSREFVANAVYPFVPAGGAPTVREVVKTEACNQCHDNLAAHGGQRRDTALCVLCHTNQTIDPESGNTVDFEVMVHRLHNGRNLPSVANGKNPYFIVGFNQSVVDFSSTNWPQDVRNCTTCHQKAAQADNWKNAPSRAACGSCHDGIDWETGKARYGGKDHVAGPQKDDKACKTCHVADSGQEFDASIVGAHVIPTRSKQLKGVVFALDGATVKAGEKPVVDFTIKDGAGAALDANKMDLLEITLAHPTTDYAHRVTESVNRVVAAGQPPFVRTGALTDLGAGKFRYVFTNPLDASWKGSVAIGMAGYKNTTFKGNDDKDTTVREGNLNPVIYVSLDGTRADPRRTVVKRENCNQCHLDLGSPNGFSVHGGIRRSPEYCVLCHNPNATDEASRPKEKLPPETIHFKYMIHSLHMGAERDTPAEFFGRAVARSEEIGFPTAGAQRNCSKCHAPGAYNLPLPSTALPTTITQAGQVVKTILPVAATCTACHANAQVVAHAQIMTGNNVETCAICHGPGRDFAVDKVHK